MKAILISIKPKYVAKILNGEKTIEIRKTMPKCDLPIDVYIYCTKDKELLVSSFAGYHITTSKQPLLGKPLNGKVVAKFTLNSFMNCKLINDSMFDNFFYSDYQLTRKELKDYVGDNDFYEWHISNLVVFDKPKELSEFYKGFRRKYYKNHFAQDIHKEKNALVQPIKCGYEYTYPLTKAPQSWCFVEVDYARR